MEATRKDEYFPPRSSLKLFEPLVRHLAESQISVPSSTVKVMWDNSVTSLLLEGRSLQPIHNVNYILLSNNILPGM